jgi:hypothetical protein
MKLKPYNINRLNTFCKSVLKTASAPPIEYAKMFFPKIKIRKLIIKASVKIPIIGPKINALGEIDFISAQIRPARQISPFSFQSWKKEIKSHTLIKDKIIPESGSFKLCRKLPRIISIEAHILPTTEALSQIEFNGL